MGEALLVGLDIGTTATKAAVYDAAGTQLAAASAGYPITRPRNGWAEQDAEDWWRAAIHALRALATTTDLSTVHAVGLVSQVNTHAFVDAALRPIGPAIVWQDQRCADIARELDGRFDDATRHRLWGGPFTIDSSYLISRAAWLAVHDTAAWDRAAWVLLPKDYVIARLTDEVATDAVSAIGLVTAAGDSYLVGAMALLDGVAQRLPRLARPTEPVGTITAAAADATGLPAGVPVMAGTMDAWGNLHGSAASSPGSAILVGGTSEIAALVSDRHVPTAGIITFPAVDGLIVHAGPTQAGGDALRWWVQTSGHSYDEVLAQAAYTPAGAGGVIFAPHLLGERAPLWDPDVRASFLGLSSGTGTAELGRAVLEGVAFSARELFEAVATAGGVPVSTIALSGGSARSDLWSQIKADVLGRPLRRLAVRDSAVLGAALLAGVGSKLYDSLAAAGASAVHVERVFEPNPERVQLYSDLFAIYRQAYGALRPVHAALTAWRDAGRS